MWQMRMNKKRWLLLILLLVSLFAWYKLFYTTYSKEAIPASADAIVTVDIKKITRTILWQYISHPSEWKVGSLFSSKKDSLPSWKDIVNLPDYLFAFHAKNQPASSWYLLLDIKNKKDLINGFSRYQITKVNDSIFQNKKLGLLFLVKGEKLLLSINSQDGVDNLQQIADEIFSKKQFLAKEKIGELVAKNNHVSAVIEPNAFLKTAAELSANLDDDGLHIRGNISPKERLFESQQTLSYSANSLLSITFAQPSEKLFSLLGKEKISKLLNVNVDSFFAKSNTLYQLDFKGFQKEKDSVISYTYDDDFNQIETVAVQEINQPVFSFSMKGKNTATVYNYLRENAKLEATPKGMLFTAIPVKNYAKQVSPSMLTFTSAGYTESKEKSANESLFFMQALVAELPDFAKNYLPKPMVKAMDRWQAVVVDIKMKDASLELDLHISKKKGAGFLFGF